MIQPPHVPPAGARLGAYDVVSLIGAGGMGEVYRARDTRLNRDVALNILPQQTAANPTAFARFEREAQAVAALSHPVAAPADSHTVAMTQAPITDAGTVLGTVGYMAPEQVRGLAVDHRPDLFALGCVIYEMCTGQRGFKGATPADTMTAVLSTDPPELTTSGPPTPPALDRIVRRCLEKQPEERFQSARDLSFALEALSSLSGPAREGSAPVVASAAPGSRRSWLPLAAVAAMALFAGAAAARFLSASVAAPSVTPAAGPVMRVEFESPSSTVTTILVSLSPDGRYVAYSNPQTASAARELRLRDLGTGAVETVPDSQGGWGATWSPRSDALVFATSNEELRHYRLGERATRPVAGFSNQGALRGLQWLPDDTLVYAIRGQGLLRVPVGGGTPVPVVADTESWWGMPSALGDSTTHILAQRSSPNDRPPRQLVAVELATGRVTDIIEHDAGGIWATPGHLLLPRANGLFAVPFDSRSLKTVGEPMYVAEPIRWDVPTGVSTLAASAAGLIAFRRQRETLLQFEWLDGNGRSQGQVGPPAFYGSLSLSPDGRRIVTRLLDGSGAARNAGLGLIDIERGIATPVAAGDGALSDPTWTADGERILYRRNDTLVVQSPFDSGGRVLREEAAYPDSVSPDGRHGDSPCWSCHRMAAAIQGRLRMATSSRTRVRSRRTGGGCRSSPISVAVPRST
jgi:hypothetical protein